ncbi:MAG: hypothetical protein MI725_12925 [Pirellulales bacterium]|nr:hypothetical protein [Pirellulales bacterium]
MSSNSFRSHAAHATAATLEEPPLVAPPSQLLPAETPQVRALLEQLDRAILAAVLGDQQALENARRLWPQIVQAIGWELVEDTRDQYLLYVLDATHSTKQGKTRDPASSIVALEIVSLLTKN